MPSWRDCGVDTASGLPENRDGFAGADYLRRQVGDESDSLDDFVINWHCCMSVPRGMIIPLTWTARQPSVLIFGIRWRPASVTK